METPIPNKKIYFSGDTAEIISDILKKYGLEETDEELAKKIFEEEDFIIHGGVILKYAISLVKKETTEKEIPGLLEKELNVSKTIAEGLTNEIKNRLVAIATTEKPKEPKTIEDKPIIDIKPPISIPRAEEIMEKIKKPILETDFNNTVSAPKTQKNNIEKLKIEEYKKNTVSKIPPAREKKQQKNGGDDRYREAI